MGNCTKDVEVWKLLGYFVPSSLLLHDGFPFAFGLQPLQRESRMTYLMLHSLQCAGHAPGLLLCLLGPQAC